MAVPAAATAQVLSASKLIGAAVRDQRGNDLGHIADLAIDVGRAHIAYVMLYANGSALTGAQVYGVAPQSLRPALRRGALVLDRAATAPRVDSARLLRATDLLGKDVGNAAGARVGDIVDLAVRLDTGHIVHAVLQTREGPVRELPLEAFSFPADGGDAELSSKNER